MWELSSGHYVREWLLLIGISCGFDFNMPMTTFEAESFAAKVKIGHYERPIQPIKLEMGSKSTLHSLSILSGSPDRTECRP